MHNRHGIIGKSVIDSVRRSLQNKYAEDRHIQQMIEELDATDDLTYEELHITKQAYEEVKSRLFYTALLDSLWQEISETQDLLAQLHVYDSLEDEFQSQGEELTSEELDIDQVDLDDVDVTERPLALRQTSAVAARQAGTVAARQEGTVVAQSDGEMLSSVNSKANTTNPNLTNSKSATSGVSSANPLHDTEVPWAPLTQGRDEASDLAVDNAVEGTNTVINAKAATASSVAESDTQPSKTETSDVVKNSSKSAKADAVNDASKTSEAVEDSAEETGFPTGEIFLQDIFNMLSKGLNKGESVQATIEDLMQHTEWKEFKKLAKQAKKSIKKAQKSAKKEAKKLAKDAKKESKKALKKAKHAKQDVEARSEEWYQDFDAVSEALAKDIKASTEQVKEKTYETVEATKSKASDVLQTAEEKTGEVKANVEGVATQVKQKASEVKDTVQDLGRSAVLQVLDIVESAIQKKPKK